MTVTEIQASPVQRSAVAIVGIAAALPSGIFADHDLGFAEFHDFLLKKGEAYTEVPRERFNTHSFMMRWAGDALGKVATTHGGFLKDVDKFDHLEFGISAKDARAMSPSTRKLIELSFLALLDSGIDYRGRNVGCYATATNHDIMNIAEPDLTEARGSFAGMPCMVANKISYHLDLRGPSIPMDTACSSSLTATHLAVQALRAGECEAAVVSACQLNLRFSRSEGAVSIVLKLYENAVKDGDHIYANVQLWEIPLKPLGWVKSSAKMENCCHLEITAFLASICKVCGIMETGVIPPNVNLKVKNPAIPWDQYRLHDKVHSIWKLFARFESFRTTIQELDQIHLELTGTSLLQDVGLFGPATTVKPLPNIWPIRIILPSLLMVHIALHDLLVKLGVQPDIVMGHSAGETAMLYACGAGSKRMAMEIAVMRGKVMEAVEQARGAMVALSCAPHRAQAIIHAVRTSDSDDPKHGRALGIACYNGPEAVAIAGDEYSIQRAVDVAQEQGILSRRIQTGVAVHSALMELCREEYCARLTEIYQRHGEDLLNPRVTTYSTATGMRLRHFTADYFWRNSRDPVLFVQAVRRILHDHPNAIFVEIGPHPILSGYLQEIGATPSSVACPMRRTRSYDAGDEEFALLTALGHVVAAGYNGVDFDVLCPVERLRSRKARTPPYPFLKKTVAYLPEFSPLLRTQIGPALRPLHGNSLRVSYMTHPDIAQHIINHEPIMPASGFLEMDVAASTLHAEGYMLCDQPDIGACVATKIDLGDLLRSRELHDAQDFYADLKHFQYGSHFRLISRCHFGNNDVLVEVRALEDDSTSMYVVPPNILDACIHVVAHPRFTANYDPNAYYLPSLLSSFRLDDVPTNSTFREKVYAYAVLRQWLPDQVISDVFVFSKSGRKICTLENLVVSRHLNEPISAVSKRFTLVHELLAMSTQASPDLQNGIEHMPSAALVGERSTDMTKIPQTLYYQLGHETAIQANIRHLDVNAPLSLWFIAKTQRDGDAARGFTRCLRREFPQWDIGLLTCTDEMPEVDIIKHIRLLTRRAGSDREFVLTKHGEILVPRFRASSSPGTQASSLIRSALPVVVTVVSDAPRRTIMTLHRDCLTRIHDESAAHDIAAVSPSILAVGMLLGADAFAGAGRGLPGRIFVVSDGSELGQHLIWFFRQLNVHPVALDARSLPVTLARLSLQTPDIIVCECTRDADIARTFAGSGARVFDCSDGNNLIRHTIASNPYLIGETLRLGLEKLVSSEFPTDRATPPTQTALDAHAEKPIEQEEHDALFKADETYILIGGIGSLGLHVARWMYDVSPSTFLQECLVLIEGQGGARSIILTSRSGRASLERANNILALRILRYLETRPDLSLKLEACDAVSQSALQALLSNPEQRIAGCILLSGVLMDRMFLFQDAESFEAVFRPKVQAFEALEATMDIESLDFFVAVSSIATFGNIGQTNYASANTALEGMMMQYRNAFAIVAPAIVDTASVASQAGDVHGPRTELNHLMEWAFSSEEFCNYLEDGIHKLADGPVGLYVPDFNWDLVHQHMGPRLSTIILLRRPEHEALNREAALQDIILRHLDIQMNEFSPEVPLTSYGIDSLSAGRIALAIRPYLFVSSMQLLGGLSMSALYDRLRETAPAPTSSAQASHRSTTAEDTELQTIVKFVDVEEGGPPLFMVHGAPGNVTTIAPVGQHKWAKPFWAVQTTPDTPLHSLRAMTQFYCQRIRAVQPRGPYRVGAYSATTVIAFMLAEELLDAGEEVERIYLLDHSPLLFISPYLEPDAESARERRPSHELVLQALQTMLALLRADPAPSRHMMAQNYEDISHGVPGTSYDRVWELFQYIVKGTYEFLFELLPPETPYSLDAMQDAVVAWLRSIKAPVTLVVAREGVLGDMRRIVPDGSWDAYGLERAFPDMRRVEVPGTHFSMFFEQVLADALQT
ncbi:beta-ketoacyl synthase [Fomitopsis serialis]|uniref:beta-ketoacyl synthase n=1 Tax=Fomitopsis serialis TaxID=139415 RepID=UPI002007DA0D|nr:beta-ketoacyl synthase [Neoantrodia serialis]KAH9922717.1 beta-ketoacyl synthase [Neoantrodia serialis]